MNKSILLLLAMPLIFASCTKNEALVGESVEASFTAELPTRTRAAGDLVVNKVVCATFQDGTEVQALRRTIDIVDGQPIVYSPRLIKGHRYQVAFWAMKDNAYNVTDMKSITPAGDEYTGSPELYECFSNSTDEFTVTGNNNVNITLTRPMARINLGTSTADMQAVETLGYTPTQVTATVSAAGTYNAVDKSCGAVRSQTMTLSVSDGSLSVNGSAYKAIASYMVFTDGSNVSLSYTVYGRKGASGDAETLVSQNIDNVPLGVNKNTNIVGELMTGSVSYSISMESAYSSDNNPTL